MTVLLILDFVFAAGILLGGYYLRFYTGDEPNEGVGIRTAEAMKSPEAWQYANRTSGRGWMITGLIGLILSVCLLIFMPEGIGTVLRILLSLLPAAVMVIGVWTVLFRVMMQCIRINEEYHAKK